MNLWLLAKSNMKKKKGNVIILTLLVILATMLLYTSVSTLKNMSSVLDEKSESQNGAHVCLVLSDMYQEEVESILKKEPSFTKLESEYVLSVRGTNDIRNITQNQKKETMNVLFNDISVNRTINDLKIVDEGKELKSNSIVLPMYLKVANDYKTGDEIEITFGKQKEKFEVYGFTENIMFANPSNVSSYKSMVSHEMFEKLKSAEHVEIYRDYNVRLKSSDDSADYEDNIVKKINEKILDPTFSIVYVLNYNLMKSSASLFISILMVVLAAFSVMIIMIALLVIRFSISSNMEDNLPNIGISEALGYTSGQLILSSVIEYLIIIIAGIAIGFVMAGVSSGYVAGIVSGSIGLDWHPTFDIAVGIVTVFLIVVLVIGTVLIMSRKFKKITPLDALRVGISTHNFKRNPLPLRKKTPGLQNTLGLKSMLNSRKQSISIIFIVMFLVYTCILSMSMYYNFVGDSSSLINLVGIEKPNIRIVYTNDGTDTNGAVIKEQAEALRERSEIKKVNITGSTVVTLYNDKIEMSVESDVYEDVDKLEIDSLIEGRRPKHDNEINITNVIADKFGIKLGDSISIKKNTGNQSYVVVGIMQQISNMGIRIMMPLDAIKRLQPEFEPIQLDVYLTDGEKATENEVRSLEDYFDSDQRFLVMNFDEIFDTVLKTFNSSISALCLAFISITVLVVILIILLIIRMKLVKEKRNMGVYKAIGYTTKQLIWQTVMGISPVVAIGALIGSVTACLTVNKIFVMMLSVSGIENTNLIVNLYMVLVCFISVTLLAFVSAALSALGVRKIEPYKMIIEG